MKKRRKVTRQMPTLILWDRRQQLRFIEAVERLSSLVNDLTILVDKKKRRSAAASAANATRNETPTPTLPS